MKGINAVTCSIIIVFALLTFAKAWLLWGEFLVSVVVLILVLEVPADIGLIHLLT